MFMHVYPSMTILFGLNGVTRIPVVLTPNQVPDYLGYTQLYLEDSGGIEPHPTLHQNPVFKAGRRTNPAASLSILFLAEDIGFEPMGGCKATVCLANRCHKPLDQSSIWRTEKESNLQPSDLESTALPN